MPIPAVTITGPFNIPGAIMPNSKNPNGLFNWNGAFFFVAMVEWNEDINTGLPNGSPSRLSVWVSDDAGITWTECDAANRKSTFSQTDGVNFQSLDTRGFYAIDNGNSLIVSYVSPAQFAWKMSQFDMDLRQWVGTSPDGPVIDITGGGFSYDASYVISLTGGGDYLMVGCLEDRKSVV